MAHKTFNDEIQIPKRLRNRLEKTIAVHGWDNLFWKELWDGCTRDGKINKSDVFQKIQDMEKQPCFKLTAQRQTKNLDAYAQNRIDEMGAKMDLVVSELLSCFDFQINQSETVSAREYQDRKRKSTPWKNIPLTPFIPDFIRWVLNDFPIPFMNSGTRDPEQPASGWTKEDWESDALYVMRGYFIAKNQGKGFSLNSIKTIGEAKEIAAPFVPKEGLKITQMALAQSSRPCDNLSD